MRIILLYLFCFLFSAIQLHATENDYAVSKIDPQLLKDAAAVKRYELIRFEIKTPGSAVYYYKTAITILSETGDKYASWIEYYDKFTTIRSVNAKLYDAEGKKIRSLKNADISDLSATSEGSLAEDVRLKRHNFYSKVYPYTVEYEVEIKNNALLSIPSWTPVEGEDLSVESSIFQVICPAGYRIRYKSLQYNKEPVISGEREKTYEWSLQKYSAVKYEYASPQWNEITPSVFVAPTNFEIDGYSGVMDTWLEFGKFQKQLNENRSSLPDQVKIKIHSLVDTVTNVKRKIAILYKYMQQNTRYISIQLGIGGWQPFDASFVATKGYGDCKALSNYMFSILKEANIRSCYTLIKAGNNNRFFLPDFPSRQSNHIILSVPLPKDTVWLECTSQELGAGYLGKFTCNRYALMIDDDGGHLVKTPDYKLNDNLEIRKIEAIIDDKGKLKAKVNTRYTGLQQDDLSGMINALSKQEQLEYLKKTIDLPNYDISSVEYKSTQVAIPSVDEIIDLVAENYAQVSGKRIFIQPNLFSKSDLKPGTDERHQDIDLPYEFRNVDTVELLVPNGFVAESIPEPTALTNQFGKYKISYQMDGNKILMVRIFERKSGRFSASSYKDFEKMYSIMYKADRSKIVLAKKEG